MAPSLGTVTGAKYVRVVGIAHQQIGNDEAFTIADGQSTQEIMGAPIGQHDLQFGLHAVAVGEFDASSGEALHVAGIVAVLHAHA